MDNSNIRVVVVADKIYIVKSQVEKILWLGQWADFCESSFQVKNMIRSRGTVEIEAGIFNAVIGRSQGVVDIAFKAPTLDAGDLDAFVKLILQIRLKSRRQPLSGELYLDLRFARDKHILGKRVGRTKSILRSHGTLKSYETDKT